MVEMANEDGLDENIVGMCTECKTIIPTNIMAKDSFAAQGLPPVCKLCGGVVTIVDSSRNIDNIRLAMDRERGLI